MAEHTGTTYPTLPQGATWDEKRGENGAVILNGQAIKVTGVETKEDFDREQAKLKDTVDQENL